MVEDKSRNAVVEAAELGQELMAVCGMALDDRELGIVERTWLLQDRVRNREFADVVEEAADREGA